MDGNHRNPSAPPSSSNGNRRNPSPAPSSNSNGSYRHNPSPPPSSNGNYRTPSSPRPSSMPPPSSSILSAADYRRISETVPFFTTVNHPQRRSDGINNAFNNNFQHVVAPNYPQMVEPGFANNVGDNDFRVVAPNYAHMLEPEVPNNVGGSNFHVLPPDFTRTLESDFSRLNLAPPVRPIGFPPQTAACGAGSNNMNHSNGVSLLQQRQLRDIQRMRIQAAARAASQIAPNFSPNFGDYSSLNEIWSQNNSPINFNAQPPRSFASTSYGSYLSNNNGDFQYRPLGMDRDRRSNADWPPYRPRQRSNVSSLEEIRGRIYSVSRDQQGCRFLQKRLEEGNPEEVRMIIMEIKDHICELMVDQFGNYLVHKVFAACNPQQITEILLSVMKDDEIFKSICVDPHGTRSVQKLLEFVRTQEQRSITISALRRITLPLAKNMNGHHVIQFCLKHFSVQDNKYILNEIAENCIEIALDKSGCCVLQQCVENAVGEPRDRLIAEITSNALLLAEHPYGNYVVQYILGLRIPRSMADILAQLTGSFVSLSMSKYGSNVVEKFLKDEPIDCHVVHIIRELTSSPSFVRVLQDPFGNYVAQSAFAASKGEERIVMMNMVLANHHNLHSHPHGKRVYSSVRNARV